MVKFLQPPHRPQHSHQIDYSSLNCPIWTASSLPSLGDCSQTTESRKPILPLRLYTVADTPCSQGWDRRASDAAHHHPFSHCSRPNHRVRPNGHNQPANSWATEMSERSARKHIQQPRLEQEWYQGSQTRLHTTPTPCNQSVRPALLHRSFCHLIEI